jgi:hypothetical protein
VALQTPVVVAVAAVVAAHTVVKVEVATSLLNGMVHNV